MTVRPEQIHLRRPPQPFAVPVNYYDPRGLMAVNPGYCPAEYSYQDCIDMGVFDGLGWGSGGGGGGGAGFLPRDPHPYETATERRQRAAAIAATIAVIAQELKNKAGDSGSIPMWPVAIRLAGMSCETNYTGAFQLNVTYDVISDLGTVMTGGELAGFTITEHFLMQTGNLGDLNQQAGTWAYPKSISSSGQFTDNLSSGDLPGFPRSGTALQEFTAAGSFGIQPLDILGFSTVTSGVNFNTYSHSLTTVNGQTAGGGCK